MQAYVSTLKRAFLLSVGLAIPTIIVSSPATAISWEDLKLNGAGTFQPYKFDKETQEILSNDTRPIPQKFDPGLFIRVTEKVGNSYVYRDVLRVYYEVEYGSKPQDPILQFKELFGLTCTGHLVTCKNINAWDWIYVVKETPNGKKRIGAFDPDIEEYIAGEWDGDIKY